MYTNLPSEAVIATREKINSLRARQRGHSMREEDCARLLQYHIMRQAEIEDDIIALEWDLAKLKKEGL